MISPSSNSISSNNSYSSLDDENNSNNKFSILNLIRLHKNLSNEECETLLNVFIYYNDFHEYQEKQYIEKHQIFKFIVPYKLIYAFIILNCDIENNIYTYNRSAYKRSKLNGSLVYLCNIIQSYYHLSKQKYIDKYNTFKGFTTILRQLCNLHSIKYTHYEKFFKSTHQVNYSIFLPIIGSKTINQPSICDYFHISNL